MKLSVSLLCLTASGCLCAAAALPVQTEKIPADVKNDPFVETAPGCAFTAAEKQAKAALFTRPLTEAVYRNTRFLDYERVTRLEGWGAPGQYISLNFAAVPLENLKNLRIEVKDCAVKPEVRQICYWKVIYPFYNSFSINPRDKRYREQPEFLAETAPVNVKAQEVQRYYLTFHLPDKQKEITGKVEISYDGCVKPLTLPFRIKILPIALKRDPAKNYSAYNYQIRHKDHWFYKQNKNNPEFLHKVQLREFQRMREYGLTMPPTFYMTVGNLPNGVKESYVISHFAEQVKELREAGFAADAPIPIPGSSTMHLYWKFTGLKVKNHHLTGMQCDKIPQALYDWSDQALGKWLAYLKTIGDPKLVFNPQDEPDPEAMPFVEKLYGIFKKHNCKTYITSLPDSSKDNGLYDYFNNGSFIVPYETAVSGEHGYWCYPNDNAYSIKDMYPMCLGGRLTFGYAFWRSGYSVLIPYIWRTVRPFRVGNSGGQLLLPDGTELIASYWECFRQGIDDMRYLYTLQEAVVTREKSKNPEVRKLCREARALLQELWCEIVPHRQYLYDDLIPHTELDGRRAQMAELILKLQKFPESAPKAKTPSVIINTRAAVKGMPMKGGKENVQYFELKNWRPADKESSLRKEGNTIYGQIKIDHSNGKCWPSLTADFRPGYLDLNRFTHLEFDLTVDSDRDAESNEYWPLLMFLRCKGNEETEFFFTDKLSPGTTKKIVIPVSKFMSLGEKIVRNAAYIRIIACEKHYPDGKTLKIKITNPRFVGFSAPTIIEMRSPAVLSLPAPLPFTAVVQGNKPGDGTAVRARLTDERGKVVLEKSGHVSGGTVFGGFPAAQLKPGKYRLQLELSKGGKRYSQAEKQLVILPAL